MRKPCSTIALRVRVSPIPPPPQTETNLAAALAAYLALPNDTKFRPDGAEDYLQTVYKFGTIRTLAKLRCVGGGPEFMKAGPQIVLYTKAALDDWARSKISAPVASTSSKAA